MKRVKPLKELINILIDGGYKPDENGDWIKTNQRGISAEMILECGKSPKREKEWKNEWLEEVIDCPCLMISRRKDIIVYVDENMKAMVVKTYNAETSLLGQVKDMVTRKNGSERKDVFSTCDFELYAMIEKV